MVYLGLPFLKMVIFHGTINIAIEHGPFIDVFFPLKMVIFHSYVSLPEGTLVY